MKTRFKVPIRKPLTIYSILFEDVLKYVKLEHYIPELALLIKLRRMRSKKELKERYYTTHFFSIISKREIKRFWIEEASVMIMIGGEYFCKMPSKIIMVW